MRPRLTFLILGAACVLTTVAAEARERACGVVVAVSCSDQNARVLTLLLQPGASIYVDAGSHEISESLRLKARPLEFNRACVRGTLTERETLNKPAVLVIDRAEDLISDGAGPTDWPTKDIYTGCDAGITQPTVKSQQPAKYPKSARQRGLEGIAMMQAILGTDGHIEQTRLLKSVDARYGLDQEALDTVKKWTFTPALLNGAPVRMVIGLEITFSLYRKY